MLFYLKVQKVSTLRTECEKSIFHLAKRGEGIYQNSKMFDGFFCHKIYHRLNYFLNSILLIPNRSYSEHTRNYFRKERTQKFASIKLENRLHEIIKILFTRKIKFRKIWNFHSHTIFSSFVDILAFLNHCIFYNLIVR